MHENFAIEEPKEKEEKKKNPTEYYVKFSFVISYILLMTTGIITFIEALRSEVPAVRHVMNLETCISVVAGYFYSVFVEKIEEFSKNDKPIDWADITITRYIDWAITTPMMLLVLCLVLGENAKINIKIKTILSIFALNYLMLYIGYLGESSVLDHTAAMILGFIPFILMFGIVYNTFLKPKYIVANYGLFTIFVSLWSMYGIVYMFNEEYKNIVMNILDCLAKSFVGLGLWAYYNKIVVV